LSDGASGTDQARSGLDTLVLRLHSSGRLRVWSLVITVFGDAVAPRGGVVPLAVLQQVLGRLGVEPGAVRTALSRLTADGWVVRERQGRNSFYRLDERGRHAFDRATRRIYAGGPPDWAGRWTVAVAPPVQEADAPALLDSGFLQVAPRVFLRPDTRRADPADTALHGMLVIHGDSAEHPETLPALWPADALAGAYRQFMAKFLPLAGAAGSGYAALDAIALRTLLIHDWRRIVLRDPGLPTALLPRDWPGEDARGIVRTIYKDVLDASEDWLDESGLPKTARSVVAARFGQSSR
jgi:phenylacetic acid degradation operon negative regulatory protein